jgi:hypothetical protein
MADATTPPTKTPWHLWVVGVISSLWNAIGAFDFTMTQLENTAYLKAAGMTDAQLEYIYGFPFWAVLAWGLATWGSLLGSVFLLMRRAWAVRTNQAVLVAMALTFTHNFILTDGLKIMSPDGKGPLVFTGIIVLVGVLLLVYSTAMRRRGVLR